MGEAFEGKLPEKFEERMRALLREEYGAFAESYKRERTLGLRLNILKVDPEVFFREFGDDFGLRPVSWCREGFYYDKEARPGRHPFHEAGVYYIQEPSAMAAAELLDPQPGERVLDLCAAPGGKSTQIGGRLLGQGLLVANEIHPARAKILSQNVERMGIANAVVTNEDPETLARQFPCFFHKIVVDAPCSGEGMFRKDPEAAKQWSLENVAMCAARQEKILGYGARMLKPGGRLVYSTCTFSPEEDECRIEQFLEQNPDFSLETAEGYQELGRGRTEWTKSGRRDLENTFRIWPHRSQGEGHYIAILKKSGHGEELGVRKLQMPARVKDRCIIEAWEAFAEDTLTEEGIRFLGEDIKERLVIFGQQLYKLPEMMPDYKGLRVLRPGLHLGTLKKNRLEPSHGLALCLKKNHVKRWESRGGESRDIASYLRGGTLTAQEGDTKGWTLMLAEAYSIGWAKRVGETLKNHYPKGLRLQDIDKRQ